MNLHQLFIVLNARRRAAFAVLAIVVVAVFLFSIAQSKQYLATAAVLVDVRSPDPVAAPGGGGGGSNSSYMATQIDLIQSERVAQRAMRLMKLDTNQAERAAWKKATGGRGQFESWMSEELLRRLEVRPSRESNVVNIGYLAGDPAYAAAAANAFVNAYVDTTLEMKVEPARQYNAFFDDRAKQLRTELEKAQARLSAYQQAKGIIATDERLDVENARLAELSTQVVTLQDLAAGSLSRKGQAGANSQEVLASPIVGSLAAELSRQEARMSELKQRLGENNPQLVELKANIAQLRSQLDVETRRASSSIGVTTSIDRSRLNAAQGELDEQRAKVLRLRSQRDEAQVLVRDVDGAQRSYDAALARVTQSNIESQNTVTNVSIIKTASEPPFPASPRVLLNTAVALVVGALLAIAFAVLRETMDRRLRFDTDVSGILRQHLLVEIPNGQPAAPARLARVRQSLLGFVSGASKAAS